MYYIWKYSDRWINIRTGFFAYLLIIITTVYWETRWINVDVLLQSLSLFARHNSYIHRVFAHATLFIAVRWTNSFCRISRSPNITHVSMWHDAYRVQWRRPGPTSWHRLGTPTWVTSGNVLTDTATQMSSPWLASSLWVVETHSIVVTDRLTDSVAISSLIYGKLESCFRFRDLRKSRRRRLSATSMAIKNAAYVETTKSSLFYAARQMDDYIYVCAYAYSCDTTRQTPPVERSMIN